VALLHDGVWLMLWYFIHSQAGAELVVFVFGPMVISAVVCATVLAIQVWRESAGFRATLGQRRPSAAFSA
jgi:hypothetical protein